VESENVEAGRAQCATGFFALEKERGNRSVKKLLVFCLIAVLLPLFATGCGSSDKDKGINSNKDKPKADRSG
jgi:hypothetical protein